MFEYGIVTITADGTVDGTALYEITTTDGTNEIVTQTDDGTFETHEIGTATGL